MAIQVRCDCGEILRIPRPAPGEEWKCPSCGAIVQGQEGKEESADAMEIPIEGSAIGLRQAGQSGQTGEASAAGQGDPGEEDLEDDLGEHEVPDDEGSRSGIPKGMLWGVFLVLLGLLGMIFLLKPGTRQEIAEVGKEIPKVDTSVPSGEDASVRVALEPGAGEGAQAPMALPPAAGGGPVPKEEAPSVLAPQAPPVAESAALPQPEPPPAAPPAQVREPAAKQAGSAAPAASALHPQPAAAGPSKPEKLAYSRQASAKPSMAYTLNVGSFKARKNAEALRQDLAEKGIEATVTEVSLPDKGTWYRVSVGRFSTPAAARRLGQELEKKWQIPSFVAQLD